MKDTTMTRRGLLASAVSFAALRATAPSDRVTVGIIGTGGRGVFETGQYPWFDNVEIVALCDAQESRRVAAKAKLESRYAEAGRRARACACTATTARCWRHRASTRSTLRRPTTGT